MPLNFIPRDRNRLITHGLCALIAFAGWGLTAWIVPEYPWFRSLTVATGYVALLLIAFTLLVGPFKMLTQKRNPVNLMLRRDAGIWAGINGLAHVWAGLQVHMGGNIQMYFFKQTHNKTLQPLTDLFGLANDIGLLATLVLVGLLILSNDLSLRWLRSRSWKWLQRSNYILVILVIIHTFGYQLLGKRPPLLLGAVVVLSAVMVTAQLIGVIIYATKNRRSLAR